MIEYDNTEVISLLKQYKMLSKSLKLTTDIKQKNDICNQMTKIIENVLNKTNTIYERKYNQIASRKALLMDEEKNRLLALINLINERITYVNNQINSNQELTGIIIDNSIILGENELREYKEQIKVIDTYKNNMKLETTLKEEIKELEFNITKTSNKINNNKDLNRRLEAYMMKIVDNALKKLSLYELEENQKEIDLAYTELGYSLEKAKENAKVARNDYTEEIVVECDNMLAAITLEYERYKEKKLILKLISIFKNETSNYEELLQKREEINNIMLNIQNSELYKIVGNELNKEYASIKLEQKDRINLENLTVEKELKVKKLEAIKTENNSEVFQKMLERFLENERLHQEELERERQREERIKAERQKELEKIKLEEMAKRQKLLEEERKKEIEERTKQLLVEKKNPVLNTSKEEEPKQTISKTEIKKEAINNNKEKITRTTIVPKEELFTRKPKTEIKKDIFTNNINNKVVDKGIPVIKNDKLNNTTVAAKEKKEIPKKVFPEIPLEKKEDIFPAFPEMNKDDDSSFFDDDEFKDLSNYMEDNNKKSWF